ncbi:MAG: hypothetical protein GF330_12965 [Candidatus Eisenbacteria bacterium]|nr:hypothetical protein [Candidatus Eisenbacteria bacterium]
MSPSSGFTTLTALVGLASLLLAAGLGVDLLVTQPQVAQVERLARQHSQLLNAATQSIGEDRDQELLADWLAEGSTREVAIEAHEEDPVTYLDRQLRTSRLNRIELRREGTSRTDYLQRNKLYLRVTGSFAHLVDFVRRLEQAPRLTVIDALTVELIGPPNLLEARLNVTIFDRWRGES